MRAKDIANRVFDVLAEKLTIAGRRGVFQGPAWAVLIAYAMFLGAASFAFLVTLAFR
jgi:hypothetical protein